MGVKLNGSTGFLEYAGRLVSSFPATILMWVGVDAATDSFVISQTKADGDGDISMFFLNNGAAKLARHRIVDNTASAQANVVNTSAFKLAMAVFTSASSRTMYFGTVGSVATDTGALSDTCSTHNDFLIGAQKGGGNAAALFFNGAVAEPHVYNVALTATDFTNLAADTVKPEAVTGWVDGWQLKTITDLTSIGGTRTLTLTGGVTNETTRSHPISRAAPDTTAPTLTSSAVANGTPTVVNLTMSEAMDTGFVPAASAFTVSGHTVSSVAITGSTINLTVSAAFVNGEAARTVAYTQPGTNNARDLAGNLLANFTGQAITNNVAAVDTTPPTFSNAQVANAAPANVVITMSETLAAFTPAASAFAVSGGKTVSSVARSGATVTLTCSAAYAFGDTITVTYTKPGTNMLQDAAGNQTASFGPSAVTNNISNGSTVTITGPSAGGKRVADGTYRASVACNAVIFNATTLVEVDRKTGLTSPSSGAFSLTSTVVSSGARVAVVVRADANGEDLGLFFATAV